MPKPVLSDSLFNASDVSQAIVNAVDFGVINTNLGVTDISSEFTLGSNVGNIHSSFPLKAYHANGFVLLKTAIYESNGAAFTSGQTLINIGTDYRPTNNQVTNGTGRDGDTADCLFINSSGTITIHVPFTSGGNSGSFIVIDTTYYLH